MASAEGVFSFVFSCREFTKVFSPFSKSSSYRRTTGVVPAPSLSRCSWIAVLTELSSSSVSALILLWCSDRALTTCCSTVKKICLMVACVRWLPGDSINFIPLRILSPLGVCFSSWHLLRNLSGVRLSPFFVLV